MNKRRGLPRLVELALASGALLLCLPILVICGALIRITSPGAALFRQPRVGRGGRLFTFVKLRTMRSTPGTAITSGDDPRITRVGALLRKTKVDELPSLWNVVKGDMRLVGPRPEVPRFVNLQDPLWREVLEDAPGLTDPVTDMLRDEESILRNVEGDRERFYAETLLPLKLQGYLAYQRTRSARSDLRVLARTARSVLGLNQTATASDEALRKLRAQIR